MKREKLNTIKGLKLLAMVVLGFMILAPMFAQAANLNPDILPPNSHPYGLTYGEWSAKWWQWVYSIPLVDSPLVDETGANAANGQSGPVWFLAGKYCVNPCGTPPSPATANRVVNIPAGKALFFPILNVEFDNLDPAGSPTLGYTEEELKTTSKEVMDLGQRMVADVDGKTIKNLDSALTTPYRVTSPKLFTYHIPDHSILELFGINLSAQDIPPPGAWADGVYLMLAPLSKGRHEIHFAGEFPESRFGAAFKLDIHYTVNVVP